MGDFEDYQEILERQDSPSAKISKSIKPLHILIFVGIFIVANQIMKQNEDNTMLYVILGSAVLLYLFSTFRGSEVSKIIPRGLAQKIALQDLKSEIRPGGSYTIDTKIVPTSSFKDQSVDTGEGMKLFKYNLGFSIKLPSKPQKEIIYQMSPFSGECKGIIEMPMGFNGQDIKDIQLIVPETSLKTEPNKNT